jgi:hypothetical protein
MNRGNLVIYDLQGKIFYQSGEASGDLLPHVYPVGIPFLEIPFGSMAGKKLVGVDVSKDVDEPILEEIEKIRNSEERIIELENQLLLAEENLIGGIL